MTVNLEVADGVGTLRLDRPPMNALDVATQDRLKELAEEATRREDVRAVVVYGGEKVFAARRGHQGDAGDGPHRDGPARPRSADVLAVGTWLDEHPAPAASSTAVTTSATTPSTTSASTICRSERPTPRSPTARTG
ncbi:hypothetical protein SGLAM104S_04893 [Streptomyces glaucescens]